MTDSDIRLGLIYLQIQEYVFERQNKIVIQGKRCSVWLVFIIMIIITIFIDKRKIIMYNTGIQNKATQQTI